MTFAEQSEKYLTHIATRKRNPARANTLASYRSILNTQILPVIGGMELSEVNQATAKLLAGRLAEARLSPASITWTVDLVKRIMRNVRDENGNRMYPCDWDPEFIDAPVVVKSEQKAPITLPQTVSEAITALSGEPGALVGLLAGSGLRIGEALALSAVDDGVTNFWNAETGTIQVRATRVRGKIQPEPKTEAGNREVNLHPALNTFLQKSLGIVQGLVFPRGYDTYHRKLRKAGIEGGFHGLRRLRETYLENAGVQRMLMKFWTGHAAADISERYIKFGPMIEERKAKAIEVGLGFSL